MKKLLVAGGRSPLLTSVCFLSICSVAYAGDALVKLSGAILNKDVSGAAPLVNSALFVASRPRRADSDKTYEELCKAWSQSDDFRVAAMAIRKAFVAGSRRARVEQIIVLVRHPEISLSDNPRDIPTRSLVSISRTADLETAKEQSELLSAFDISQSNSTIDGDILVLTTRRDRKRVFVSDEELRTKTADQILSRIVKIYPIMATVTLVIRDPETAPQVVSIDFQYREGRWKPE